MPRLYQDPPRHNQEAFDRVWQTFVVEHQPRATRPPTQPGMPPSCVYRTEDGQGCAIGCQLPDALYTEHMEGFGISYMLDRFPGVANHFGGVDETLLEALQSAHDNVLSHDPAVLEQRLRDVATEFNLSLPE